jgi:serine/threonine protein kinase
VLRGGGDDSRNSHVSWRRGDLIGTGANGRVYLGLEEDSGAIIAVKEMAFSNEQELEELAQMQEEIELLRSLQHPNIVTYLGTDICDENKLLYIFTEWVPGGSIQAQTQCRIYLARFTAN